MIVAIDVGNSRLKWGIHDGDGWIARGVLPTAEAGTLAEMATNWPPGVPIVACNVAGELAEHAVAAALQDRHELRWLRSSAAACGVRSSYERPETLGADRWAALIGARGKVRGECLVVCAGTATTIDHLDAEGVFRGGLILPGLHLMRASLARNTANLPLAEGRFCESPRSTDDAIASGCLFAQLATIERRFTALPAGAACLLTGGAAATIAVYLNIPYVLEHNLILDGLVRFGNVP